MAVIRLVSLIGSIGSLLAVSSWVESSGRTVAVVAVASIFVAIFNLFDAVRRLASLPAQERALALTKLSLANPAPRRL
jgi:hypothetical protein